MLRTMIYLFNGIMFFSSVLGNIVNQYIENEENYQYDQFDIMKLKDAVKMQRDQNIDYERDLLELFKNRRKIKPVVWNNHTYIYISGSPRPKEPVIPSQAPHLHLPEQYFNKPQRSKNSQEPSTTVITPAQREWERELELIKQTLTIKEPDFPEMNKNKKMKYNEKFLRAIGIARQEFRKRKRIKEEARKKGLGKDVQPQLLTRPTTNFILSRAAPATLPCRVTNAEHFTVYWIKNGSIITADNYRYTFDERFESQHSIGSEVYDLRISNVILQDTGTYACQVDTEPPLTSVVHLSVIEAYSVIFGSEELVIQNGDELYLLCMVLEVMDVPDYLLWYRDQSIIDYSRENVEVKTDEETRSSELTIKNISFDDTGMYQCFPSNAKGSFVNVTVIPRKNLNNDGPSQCLECPLIFQLGATFIFFSTSFLIAFCFFGGTDVSWDRKDSNDELSQYPHFPNQSD